MTEKEIKEFNIRPATIKDSRRVWEIRNHPTVRNLSNNQEVIDFKKHDQWFLKKYFSELPNCCYILETDKVIGYCRLDQSSEGEKYLISIALDPNFHGQGLGSLLLKKAVDDFCRDNSDKIVIAEVKKDNTASMKLFKKNNFNILKQKNNNYLLKYEV